MQYFIYLLFAIMLVLMLMISRPTFIEGDNDRSTISESVGWIMFIYSLILAFSITVFYERYVEMRNSLLDLVYNLETMTEYLSNLEGTDEIILKIKDYAVDMNSNIEGYRNGKEFKHDNEKYDVMRSAVVKYFSEHNDISYGDSIIDKMSSFQKINTLMDEIKSGNHYIGIIWYLTFFVYVMLWLNSLDNNYLEIITETVITVIIMTAIYLCDVFNDPFSDSPVNLDVNHLAKFANSFKIKTN